MDLSLTGALREVQTYLLIEKCNKKGQRVLLKHQCCYPPWRHQTHAQIQ